MKSRPNGERRRKTDFKGVYAQGSLLNSGLISGGLMNSGLMNGGFMKVCQKRPMAAGLMGPGPRGP